MKILFLAPQPFFQERGTPIAVRLAVEVLASREHDSIDLLTYHEGQDIHVEHMKLHRIAAPSWLKNIGPGISWKKLLLDIIFFFTAVRMVLRKKEDSYDLIHAVEESVFIAWALKLLFGIPYIYDMDSSLALQLTEKWYLLRPLQPFFNFFEKVAVRSSVAVVPVCDALAAIADKHGSRHTWILRDISLLDLNKESENTPDLKAEAGLTEDDVACLYIGNLESYQGIDLFLESFALIFQNHPQAHLLIIGGTEEHRKKYQEKAHHLQMEKQVHLLGPRPVSSLSNYLTQADILVSPRVKGNNTPMKIYSYLHAGVPTLATRLYTHTQVLDDSIAALAEPTPEDFGAKLSELFGSSEKREALGRAAREAAEKHYTFEIFEKRLHKLYDQVGNKISSPLVADSSHVSQ